MSAFVEVVLDTTAPNIECSVPQEVIYGDNTYIEVTSDEPLSINHEIILTGGLGNSKQLTFNLDGNKLSGLLDISGLSGGMASLTINVYDDVMNKSETLIKNFIINTTLAIANSEVIKITNINMTTTSSNIKIDTLGSNINTKLFGSNIEIETLGSNIEIDIESEVN